MNSPTIGFIGGGRITCAIPVKPLAAMEPQVIETYRSTLPAIYQKIKP